MIRVGLTGSVAAGKSTVGRLFESWGAARIDADRLAREAVSPGTEGLARIAARWGDEVLAPDGTLDRDALRRRVFGDEPARAELEKIVHAEVRRLRDEWRRNVADRAEVVVEEIPLLYETNLDAGYDVIVVVDAPRSLRRMRAAQERGWTAGEFDAVEAAQLDPAEKRARADHVLWNDRDVEALERSARDVWEEILRSGGRTDAGGGSAIDAAREGR